MKSTLPHRASARRTVTSLLAWALALALALACSDGSGPGVQIARVEVNLGSPTLLLGTNAAAAARAFDLAGSEIAGTSATWKSSAAAIVSVSSSGILTGNAVGTATISATIRGVTGTANVSVVPLPVNSIQITPNGGPVERGQSLQLRADLFNQFNELITDRHATWTTSASGIAQVTSNGVVNGVAAGSAIITASVEDKSASVTITVVVNAVPGGPSISSISPALLTPGVVATIRGTNFGETPALNEVRVQGIVATVLSASATELTVQLGQTGYGCEPTRQVYVQVVHLSAADARLHPLQSVAQRTMQPGESLILSSPIDPRCVELSPTGGRYLVSVYNIAPQVGADTAFRLRGASGLVPAGSLFAPMQSATPSTPQRNLNAPRRLATTRADLGTLLSVASERAERDAHARLLQANTDMLRHGGTVLDEAPSLRAAARASVTANQPVGSIVAMKIPNVGGFLTGGLDFCTDFIPVNARVAYNGTKAIILEDVAAPLAGQMDSLFEKVGREFDDVMYDVVRTNFGDPLRMDDVLDANGKIIMLFSHRVNAFQSIAGFVVSCDFKTAQAAPSSNHAEVFYSLVPTDVGTDITKRQTRSGWYRTVRSTIVHELKHIAAFAARTRDFGGSLEEPWLEESTARQSEELWARVAAYGGLQQNANATYAQTIFCDVRPVSAPQCAGKPYAMVRHFEKNGLYDFMTDPEQHSPLGNKAGFPDGSYYATGWSLSRWGVDVGGLDEAAFFNALVHTNQTSVANLSARLGRQWEELLGEWSLALYLDDAGGVTPLNTRLTFPSWNLRSIFAGLNTDFATDFPLAFPLAPRPITYGDFSQSIGKIAGGGFALFQLSGTQTGRQLLQLQSPAGGEASSRLRMAIYRIE